MTNKEYLSQYLELWKDINVKIEEAERLRSQAEKVTAVLSDMPKGQGGQDFTSAADKLVEVQFQISRDVLAAISKRNEIEQAIDAIHNPNYRRLLRMVYINGETLMNVAVLENYSYHHLCAMHGDALKQITQSP